MQVKTIMHSGLETISSEANVREAAQKMAELNIGALLVIHENEVHGIFSERDILKKVIGLSRKPEKTCVKDVMTKEIITVELTEQAHIALSIMEEKRFRHLPVVDDNGDFVGMLGIRDLIKAVSENIESENKAISKYIGQGEKS